MLQKALLTYRYKSSSMAEFFLESPFSRQKYRSKS
jgi:hypothetical protein